MMIAVRLLIALGVVALLLGLLHAPAPSSPAVQSGADAPGTVPSEAERVSTASVLEANVTVEVNRARARVGCGALKVISTLHYAARRHTGLMARHRQLSHRLPGEPTLARRVYDAGYRGAVMLGETLSVGPRTATEVVRRWMASSPHRAILLDCRYRAIGVGVAGSSDGRRWWTVDVGRR